jgi:cysteinyl-tRNA synthetase
MHNGFLQVEGEKMAKSAGNFVTVHELLTNWHGYAWPGEVVRLNMLRTHYRQPLDWTAQGLEESRSILSDWQELISDVNVRTASVEPSQRIVSVLCDDLNTPEVVSSLHELASEKNQTELYANLVFLGVLPDQLKLAQRVADEITDEINLPEGADEKTINLFVPKIEEELDRRFYGVTPSANVTTTSSTTFSILTSSERWPSFLIPWTKHHPGFLSSDDRECVRDKIGIETLNEEIERRLAARAAKDFKEADRIRGELEAMGITLKDAKDPNTGELTTTWEVAR